MAYSKQNLYSIKGCVDTPYFMHAWAVKKRYGFLKINQCCTCVLLHLWCHTETVLRLTFCTIGQVLNTLGTLQQPREVYIIAEQLVISKISSHSSDAALLSSFYMMNMQFPHGLSNFYTVLEILLLNQCPKRIPIVVSQVISLLKQ